MRRTTMLFLYFLWGSCLIVCRQTSAQSKHLDDYLKAARANSPLLKNYPNQLDSNRIERLIVKAANRPQVLANGQVAIYPVINGYGYDQAVTNGGNYSAVVSASQPLFNGKKLQPQYRQIAIQSEMLSNGHQIDILDLEKNIISQYLTAFGDWQQWQSNKEVYQILQSQQDILKQLTAQGIYKPTDYLNYLTSLQSQEVSVDQLELQYKNNLFLLNYLSGIDDTTEVDLAYPDIALRGNLSPDSSVFLQSYQLDSLQIVNQKALLKAQYKPSLSWFADAGWQTSMLKQSYHDFGTSFGLNFSVPVYDGKQRALKDQQLAIAEENRQNTSDFYHKQLNQQIAMLTQQLDGTSGLINKINDRLKTVRLLVDANKKLLNTGDVRITDYILALNNYLTLKSNLNQQEINRYQVINQLNYWQH
jgi:outer membrane protein TolC